MTDRFAVALYERLFIPRPWVGPLAWTSPEPGVSRPPEGGQ